MLINFNCKKTASSSSQSAKTIQDEVDKQTDSLEVETKDVEFENVISGAQVLENSLVTAAADLEVPYSANTLSISTNLSIVPVKNDSLGFRLTNTDFENEKVESYTWDDSQKPLEQINNILCVVARSGFSLKTNDGTYIAQINLKDCFRERGGNMGQDSAQSKGKQIQYTDVFVNAAKDENKPLEAKFWYTQEDDGKSSLKGAATAGTMTSMGNGSSSSSSEIKMYLHLIVAEPRSEKNPFGVFELKWEGFSVTDNTEASTPSKYGYISISKAQNKESEKEYILLKYSDYSDTGYGSMDVASASALLEAGEEKILSGIAQTIQGSKTSSSSNNYGSSYGYGSAGSMSGGAVAGPVDPMSPNSGMAGGNYGSGGSSSGSTGELTWSYKNEYSIAFDENNMITLNKNDQSAGSAGYVPPMTGTQGGMYSSEPVPVCRLRDQYDAQIWSYKLFDEHGTKVKLNTGMSIMSTTLNEWGYPNYGWASPWGVSMWGVSDGQVVYSQDWSTGDKTYYKYIKFPGKVMKYAKKILDLTELDGISFDYNVWDSVAMKSIMQILQYDYSKNKILIKKQYNDTTYKYEAVTSEQVFSPTFPSVNFYSPYLGSVEIILNMNTKEVISASVPDQADVTLTLNQTGVSTINLNCFSNCPKAGITRENITSQAEFFTNAENINSPVVYQFDLTTRKLMYGGNEVGFASGINLESTNYQWSCLTTGGMVTDSILSVMQAANKQTWQVSQENEYFVYQLGQQDWCNFAWIRETDITGSTSGDYVTFDSPIKFKFKFDNDIHPFPGNSYPSADDKTFFLTYDNGWFSIPYEQRDDGKWGSAFTLKRGAELNSTQNVKYKITPTWVELIPIDVDLTDCSQDLQTQVANNDLEEPEAPSKGLKDKVGAKPTGDYKISIVDGELVE